MTRKYLLLFAFSILLSAVAGCSSQPEQQTGQSAQASAEPVQIAESAGGMVSAAHPLATRAGVQMLEQGGNAADAAVATAFALSVVEPSMSGLGGRMQAIIGTPKGSVFGVDATTQAPASYNPETATQAGYGYPVIGVPGVVKGLTTLLSKYGTLPLETVMQPAIQYAEEGFEVLPGEAARHGAAIEYIREFEGTSQYYLNGDTTHQAGELLVQKDLAGTLKKIAAGGADAFYKGEIADKIVADVQANGGVLTKASLAGYEALDAKILEGNYRNKEVYALDMPCYGAVTIEMLQMLNEFPMDELTGAEWASTMYQVNTLAYRTRPRRPDYQPSETLVDPAFARKLADSIKQQMKEPEMTPANRSGSAPHYLLDDIPPSWLAEVGHTTSLAAADKDGMMIALTQSLGPNMGSRVATPGLGFLYAATLGGYLGEMQPGERAASHISPTLLMEGGKPYLALGAAGGSRIITAVVQSICRLEDQQLPLNEALAAGRVHSVDTAAQLEMHGGPTWNPEVATALREMGIDVIEVDREARFGRVHAILRNPGTGQFTGAADPDWEGSADFPEDEKE